MTTYNGSLYRDRFCNRLKQAMEIKNMRQIDLSKKTGIGRSAISQYLSGLFEPRQEYIFKIAQALNVSEAWLMGFDVEMDSVPYTSTANEDIYLKKAMNEISRQDPQLAKLIDSYMNLTEQGRDILLGYADGLLVNGKNNYSKN